MAFTAGLMLSSLAIADLVMGRWPVLFVGWALTIWSSRSMIIVIAHQCIHRRFSGVARIDRFCGELVTVLAFIQDAQTFKVEHIDAHHQRWAFATESDPPVGVLMKLGFLPGMTRSQLWHRAWRVFLTPCFYWRGFCERLNCNLTRGCWRRVGFTAWAGYWILLPFWLHNGIWVLLFAFAFPVIPVAQLSALLDKLGEHAWLKPPDPAHGSRYFHCSATWARFCGDPVPQFNPQLPWTQRVVAWLKWTIRLMFYHLPSRLFVIVGDLPNHDYHHRHPSSDDWMVAAYARQRDVDLGIGATYIEIWGIAEAISCTFDSLSAGAILSRPPTFQEASRCQDVVT